jgi:hypothetical protein
LITIDADGSNGSKAAILPLTAFSNQSYLPAAVKYRSNSF